MKHSLIKWFILPVLLLGLALVVWLISVPASAADDLQHNGTVAAKTKALPKTQGTSESVETQLKLSGPDLGDTVYEKDNIVFTATLTDRSSGEGIKGRNIKVTAYIPGGSSVKEYGSTDEKGEAKIKFNNVLDEGEYRAYAEFDGSQNMYEPIYSASGESNTVSFSVKAGSRSSTTEPSENPEEGKIPTTVSITKCSKDEYGSTSSYTIYKFNIAAYDKDGNPVNEDVAGYKNIELHIIDENGKEDVETVNLDPEGKYNDVGKAQIKKQLASGEYEIFVKYIGRGEYASSESSHYALKTQSLKEDGSIDLPVIQTGGDESSETQQPSDNPQTGGDQDPGTIITKIPPVIIDGKGQSVIRGTKTSLTFRSNAEFKDFLRVEVDRTTLDPGSYTIEDGSTIVTLKPEYVASLPVGVHILGIVSNNGTAETAFTVKSPKKDGVQTKSPGQTTDGTKNETVSSSNTQDKISDTGDSSADESPKTGDRSNVTFWIILMLVSTGTLFAAEIHRKKRN